MPRYIERRKWTNTIGGPYVEAVYIRRGQPKLEPIFIALPVLVVLGRVVRCASAEPQKG